MHSSGFRLGIDFGTSHTVAILRWPDGRAKPLLFDGSPVLPSAVYAEPGGSLATGRDAVHSARIDPTRFEPNPKRRIDDGGVLLGRQDVKVTELIAAVLARVAEEVRRTAGEVPPAVTLTCPATWGATRRGVLTAAAALAGLGAPALVEEPVAAATYFAQLPETSLRTGAAVVVYDLGGGTFDVSVVTRTPEGFHTVAVAGRDDIGGLDLDHALVRRIGDVHGAADPPAWQRLAYPSTPEERRARRLFWDDVRAAKERLSRHASAELHVPLLDRAVHLTREEFEQLARPLVAETVGLTADTLHRSGVPAERLAGVFLVGGSSRIPLVATAVHQGLRIAPTVLEQPELVVAEGAVVTAASAPPVSPGLPPVSPAPPVSPGLPPVSPASAPGPAPLASPTAPMPVAARGGPGRVDVPPGQVYGSARKRRRRWPWYAAAALLLVAALAGGYLYWPDGSGSPNAKDGDAPATDPRLPDLLYNGDRPVVRNRNGKYLELPEGGKVNTIVAVPTGVVVTRATGSGAIAQHVDNEGDLVQESDRDAKVYVNTAGTLAAVFSGAEVAIWRLDSGETGETGETTTLPGGASPYGWLKNKVLIRTAAGGFDYWDPARGDYVDRAHGTGLTPLGGRDADDLLIGATEQQCLALFDPAKDFAVTDEACDTGLELERVGDGKLPVVSPDGRHLLAFHDGVPAVASVERLLAGEGDVRDLRDVPANVRAVSWGHQVVYLMTGGDSPAYWRCGFSTGECLSDTPPERDGLTPRPVVRFGLSASS